MSTAIPTPRQLEYQDWEFGIFVHFGIRTFYEGHRDFDGQPMDPARFSPSDFDAGQWAATAAEAGAKYMVLTAKHHDGFANWPSTYTDFSVAASPWKEGKGDVVRAFVDACNAHGVKPGLYYSPADWACPAYEDERAYDDYFIRQISEILTGYGEIHCLWFDGCGSQGHTYDWPRIVREVRAMQPGILIFNMGDPDYRWVGNEAGVAPHPLWNTVASVDVAIDTATKDVLGKKPRWLPAECDCRMRERNWFYSDADEDTVKSVEELMGLYDLSIGRGANLLLNIGPDRRGRLPEADTRRLLEFGEAVRKRFASPLAELDDFTRDDDGWVLDLDPPRLIEDFVIQEDLTRGEHVRRWQVEILPTSGRFPIRLLDGESLGHKTIRRVPRVEARQIRFRILDAEGEAGLRGLSIYG